MQLIYGSGERHEVTEVRLKVALMTENYINAPFEHSLLGTIKIFFIMRKLKDIRV